MEDTNQQQPTGFTPEVPPHLDLPLQPLPKPIALHVIPKEKIEEIGKPFSTLQPFYKYGDNQALWDRRNQALGYTAEFFMEEGLRTLPHLGRKPSKETFAKVIGLLNDLTYKVLTASTTVIELGRKQGAVKLKDKEICASVYTIDSYRFITLQYQLQKLLGDANTSFLLAGKRCPDVPAWPQEGGSIREDFLRANELEILTITFRASVEHFLSRLDSVHDFSTGRSHFYPILEEQYGRNDATTLTPVSNHLVELP
ncbi:hypothetical protein V5O48_015377 [Marasmius crinis-equi]|uniref:Uncharacterized protein n=1 Tax=Marasmius crinis-equi TaxID=585013 RepID=A0ABR3EUP6_9AGAR